MQTDDVLDLTFAQFLALSKEYEEREKAEYWRAGLIASTIANVNRDAKKKQSPYEVQDFMPSFGDKEDAENEERLMNYWERVTLPRLEQREKKEKNA